MKTDGRTVQKPDLEARRRKMRDQRTPDLRNRRLLVQSEKPPQACDGFPKNWLIRR